MASFANFQKSRKMGVFVRQNSPLRNDFVCFFPYPSSWPVREVRFGPPNFDRGLKTRISSDDRWVIINDHFWSFRHKNQVFSPIKIWSKWSLKIAPKPSVLRKKFIKATLKYTDWWAFCTYWLWCGCWGSACNLMAKIVKICVF